MAKDLDLINKEFPIRRPTEAGRAALLPGALTKASSDQELVALWLRRPNLSADTLRAGAKEAARFLMWCAAHHIGLREVRYEHLVAYSEFLDNPRPADQWIAPAKYRRDDPRWRPFCGKLQPKSQLQALIILKGLFAWSKAAGYLNADPSRLLGRLSPGLQTTIERYLPQSAIPYLLSACSNLPSATAYEQLRKARITFSVMAYYSTATRLRELVTAQMSSFQQNEHGQWWLHIIGKGSRAGKVPVAQELIDALKTYRSAFGLPPLPAPNEALPLLLSTRGKQRAISARVAARNLQTIFKAAAKLASAEGKHHLAARMESASTHWLRHSQLTHQADAGVPLKSIQLNGRHADISTAGLYQHREESARHAETVAIPIIPRE